MSHTSPFLQVTCGAGEYLVPIESVVEVLPMLELQHRSESDDPTWAGLLEYRGRVIPVHALSPADRAGCDSPDWFLVVVRQDSKELAWVLRSVEGVVPISASARSVLETSAGGAVVEVAQLDGRVVRLLRPGSRPR